jgi:hypothetical protein
MNHEEVAMVPLMSLWLPILLSAVMVFVASSIIHMVLKYHSSDFKRAPKEEELQAALRNFSIPAGDYVVPCPSGAQGMKDPKYQEMVKQGPIAVMTVFPGGSFNMGASLAKWFVFCLVVSAYAAYVTGRAVGAGTPYLAVFRFAGATAFAGYVLGAWPSTIWYRRSVSTHVKLTFDGLVYALLTAGTFGWLWPR